MTTWFLYNPTSKNLEIKVNLYSMDEKPRYVYEHLYLLIAIALVSLHILKLWF